MAGLGGPGERDRDVVVGDEGRVPDLRDRAATLVLQLPQRAAERLGSDVPEEVVSTAATEQAPVIVIGLRRRSSTGRLLFGSTAQRILLDADCPSSPSRHPRSTEETAMQINLGDLTPETAGDAWVAPGAFVIGAVVLDDRSSVWYGAVLRGDGDAIRIGARSNIQDSAVVHTDPGHPVTVGSGVSVGHGAVLHGCTIEDDVLVGMNATVLNGARVGAGSLIAAGALVPEGAVIPPGSLVAGVPGKVRRELAAAELEHVRANAEDYVELARRHAAAVGLQPGTGSEAPAVQAGSA